MNIKPKDFLQQMEENGYMNINKPDSFLMDRYDAENFKLFGINFGGKKSKDNANGMTDEQAAALMNKRRQETKQIQIDAGISDAEGNIIGIRQKAGKPKPAKKPRKPLIDLPGLLSTIGDVLGGNKESDTDQATQWTAETIAKAKTIGNVDVISAKPAPLYSKGEKTLFYLIIAAVVITFSILLIKKYKK